ncbi:MAG: ROK family transcriptional regulator [Pseudoxanthomonas sp.]
MKGGGRRWRQAVSFLNRITVPFPHQPSSETSPTDRQSICRRRIAKAPSINAVIDKRMDKSSVQMKTAAALRFEPRDELHPGKLRVLQNLHRFKQASRTELAKSTGLSLQSLTRIMQELLEAGLVSEVARRRGGRGQPAIEMTLRPERLMTTGLVLQHDRIDCLLGDVAGGTFRRAGRTGDFRTAAASLAAAMALMEEMLGQLPSKAAMLGIGVSQSGFFFQPGSSRLISRSDAQGWFDTDVAATLQARFGLPVFVENDGTAAAVGHMVGDIGKRYRSFFVVLLTRGVGGGAVEGGRLVRGRLGNAGELAVLLPSDPTVIRPTTESLEASLSASRNRPIDDARIEAALANDDPTLTQWLDAAARVLDEGLRSVTALLDPEAVILAGPLPVAVRANLASRLSFEGPRAGKVAAPTPEVVVDPNGDCLEIGAQALPVVHFFEWGRTYMPTKPQPGRRSLRV